ncbi:16S rRNA (guanine(527)-N(7))-methyltransferase RsmG [Anaerosphaera multitolerans]|uniref:Ribosomal RNA small subunit methyltransferase G n=1 Tax=Anaerosphaera multitolerans TaxID=2487351 RepID=A0A437S9E9_9FIRM|nr:16S rRNA (guanine(527)-N(7))-methyltransferase RsmG [Anaerosphaera multitolerans]RVU55750.1 16S rRNA (guanine(527)-N(7))-methyltransferase RsmG [Anaerosphaera multitolerans]
MTLEKKIKDFGLEPKNVNKLIRYKELLLQWNEKMNLTAITDSDEVDVKHFLDSLSLFKTKYFNGAESVIDIGTGAGFPGLVLKIYNEDLKITLVDSLNKRLGFLKEVIEELDLQDIERVHGRAEELGRKPEYREQFDIATSRAVANLSTLLEYDLPFVKEGGYFIAMKGPEFLMELEKAKSAMDILGGELKEVIEVRLPMDITHYLIVIKKIKKTPKKYPRGGGKPKNRPL